LLASLPPDHLSSTGSILRPSARRRKSAKVQLSLFLVILTTYIAIRINPNIIGANPQGLIPVSQSTTQPETQLTTLVPAPTTTPPVDVATREITTIPTQITQEVLINTPTTASTTAPPTPPTDIPPPRDSATPTNTLRPTDPPVPTNTPVPTPNPNTQPGSLLELGQTWKQNGIELTLAGVQFSGNSMRVTWRFENNTGQDILVRYHGDNFTFRDNTSGQELNSRGFYDGTFIYNIDEIVKSGEYVINTKKNGRGVSLLVYFDPAITKEILVTAYDIARIEQAQWIIRVNLT
jgi:hypothetical protein